MKSFFKFFVKRHLLANALTVMILLMGLYSFFTINREEFPNAETGLVIISTTYPGASPEDVELNVTNKLEDSLKGVVGLKSLTSSSEENSSTINIEIDEDYDLDEVFGEIQDAVAKVTDLPDDAKAPSVKQRRPARKTVLEVGLSSTILSYAELRDYAHQFEKQLLDVPGVGEVVSTGYRDREIQIEVSPDKLVKHDLSMNEVMQAIEARNIRASGGSLESYTSQKSVVTLAKFRDPQEVGEVIIKSFPGGGVVTVNDVAKVFDDFEEEQVIPRINGKPTISFNVKKTENADIIRTVDAIKAMIAEAKTMLPPDTIDFLFTADESIGVRDKFDIVKSNGLMGLALVVVVLALFLNIRSAIWVAMGIPVSLLSVLVVLPFFGVELDSLTMAAMVLVLGIIVDDAIVITENIFQHREQGESPLEAAVNGLYEVALPVLTTVVTTVLAFLPMLFIKGMLGKFIFVIPITVLLSLGMSMFESYFILPAHLLPGLRGGQNKTFGRSWFRPIRDAFERALQSLLNFRYVLAFVACLILGGSLWYANNSLRFVLTVRSANVESITIRVNMPIGTSLEATSDTTREIERIVEKLPDGEIDSYLAQIGTGGRNASNSPHLATLTLDLAPPSSLQRPVVELQSELRQKIKAIKGIKSFSMGFSTKGPPSGEPVEIMVKGANDNLRSQFANEVIAFLNTLEGVSDVERDDKLGKDEISLQINFPLLARYGLTVADVSQTVRIAYDGQVATTTRYGDEDIDFRVILQREYRKDMNYLKQLKIPNKQGEFINLEEIATFHVGPGIYAFYHDRGERTITVTGELDDKVITSLEVMNTLKDQFRQILPNYPGIRMDIGGEAEESRQAMQDIAFSFALAALGIYFLLMVLFDSLTQPFIVLISVPFGVAGVIVALALHGISQASFFTGIGIVGLAGVVVNDALVMVDHLNALRRKQRGQNMVALIAQGAANRLRPVILTTVTTVAGLLPLTYGIGGEDTMMGPMAMAMGYGLLFATPVTLIILPCLYMIWDDVQRGLQRVFKKSSPVESEV